MFNRSKLQIAPLAQRCHGLDGSVVMPLESRPCLHPELSRVADHMKAAQENRASIILMMGAHVIRSGVQRFIIDLMERGAVACIAMNGAGVIHDYELALIGATTESVARYIKDGAFGLWQETGRINDIVTQGAHKGLGLGEAVGQYIEDKSLPQRHISILAAGYRLGIPVTVHVGIGYDIVYEFPNCNGAAYGATSYSDFLKFTRIVQDLEGGVVMNFGSAVMAPEVFLKALSMARNVARQQNRHIRHFSTLVCDLVPLPETYDKEPSRDDARYYFRPWKTMLVRTVADGGNSYYVSADHKESVPQLWSAFVALNNQNKVVA